MVKRSQKLHTTRKWARACDIFIWNLLRSALTNRLIWSREPLNNSLTHTHREKMEQAYEFAIDNVGLDVSSYSIWSDYITFKKAQWVLRCCSVACCEIFTVKLSVQLLMVTLLVHAWCSVYKATGCYIVLWTDFCAACSFSKLLTLLLLSSLLLLLLL